MSLLGAIQGALGVGAMLKSLFGGDDSGSRQAGQAAASAQQLEAEKWRLFKEYLDRIQPYYTQLLGLEAGLVPLYAATAEALGLAPLQRGGYGEYLQQLFSAQAPPWKPQDFAYQPYSQAWAQQWLNAMTSPTTPFQTLVPGQTKTLAEALLSAPQAAQYASGGRRLADEFGRAIDVQPMIQQMYSAIFNPRTAQLGGRPLERYYASYAQPAANLVAALEAVVSPKQADRLKRTIQNVLETKPELAQRTLDALRRGLSTGAVEDAYSAIRQLAETAKPTLLPSYSPEERARQYYQAAMAGYTQDIADQYAKAAEAAQRALGAAGLEGSSFAPQSAAALAVKQAQDAAKAKAQALAEAWQLESSLRGQQAAGAQTYAQLLGQQMAGAQDVLQAQLQRAQFERQGALTEEDLRRQYLHDYINQLMQARALDVQSYELARQAQEDRIRQLAQLHGLRRQSLEDALARAQAWAGLQQTAGAQLASLVPQAYEMYSSELQRQLGNLLKGYEVETGDWARQMQALRDLYEMSENTRLAGIQGALGRMGVEQQALQDAYSKMLDWWREQQGTAAESRQNYMTLLGLLDAQRRWLAGFGMPQSIFGSMGLQAGSQYPQLASLYADLAAQSRQNWLQNMQSLGQGFAWFEELFKPKKNFQWMPTQNFNYSFANLIPPSMRTVTFKG